MAKFQFRLRTLILAVVIVALALAVGIQTVRLERLRMEALAARRQADAARVAEIRARMVAETALLRAVRSGAVGQGQTSGSPAPKP